MSLEFDTAFAMIPHKEKRHFGGEDAFAIDTMAQYILLIVADGIGGWQSKYGYSASKFTHSIVAEINNLFKSGIQDPETLVEEALKNIYTPGACTMVIAIINKYTQTAYTYQVGDADYILVSPDGKIKARGESKFRGAKNPTQGAMGLYAPNRIEKQHMTLEEFIDEPVMNKLQIVPGDTLILASDGLWDNIFKQEIIDLYDTESDLELFRDEIVDLVMRRLYNDPPAEPGYRDWNRFPTPYSRSRQEIDPEYMDSPKVDDTTFVIFQTS